MKHYRYFVSYSCKDKDDNVGLGNCIVVIHEKITSGKAINAVCDNISKSAKKRSIVILNFILIDEFNGPDYDEYLN